MGSDAGGGGSDVNSQGPPCAVARALLALLPARASGFLLQVREDFSGDFMVMLFCTYFGIKGALYPLSNRAQKVYYLDYARTSASNYQQYITFSSTPWALKALFGALSDTIPIRGYYKTPYMIAATLLGVLAFSTLASVDMEGVPVAVGNATAAAAAAAAANTTVPAPTAPDAGQAYEVSPLIWLAPILFFFCNLQISVVDLLTEGRYAAMMVAKPHTGSSLVTWVWVCVFSGTLLMSGLIGPVSEAAGARPLFAIGIPFSLQVLIPVCLGYLKEVRDPEWVAKHPPLQRGAADDAEDAGRMERLNSDGDSDTDVDPATPDPIAASTSLCCLTVKTGKLKAQWRMYALAVFMTFAAFGNSIQSLLLTNRTLSLACTWTLPALVVMVAYWAMPRVMASAVTYIFLTSALYLAIPGPMDAWYTREERCVPGGPHFDNTYYLTYSGIVGSLAALLGVALFQIVFKDSTFRRAFWMTTVFKVVASLFDFIIVNRWHRPYIPDKVMFMFGDAIISDIVGMLDFMPAVVLISKLCPPGYESLVYAMLGGFQNFGYQVALSTGLYVTEFFGVYAKADGDCNWDNLPAVIVISHSLLPLITVPLTFCLLPEAKLTDDLMNVAKDGADSDGDGPGAADADELEMVSAHTRSDLGTADAEVDSASVRTGRDGASSKRSGQTDKYKRL